MYLPASTSSSTCTAKPKRRSLPGNGTIPATMPSESRKFNRSSRGNRSAADEINETRSNANKYKRYRAVHSSMRSMGSLARSRISGESSTCGVKSRMQSRTFSSVFIFMK